MGSLSVKPVYKTGQPIGHFEPRVTASGLDADCESTCDGKEAGSSSRAVWDRNCGMESKQAMGHAHIGRLLGSAVTAQLTPRAQSAPARANTGQGNASAEYIFCRGCGDMLCRGGKVMALPSPLMMPHGK